MFARVHLSWPSQKYYKFEPHPRSTPQYADMRPQGRASQLDMSLAPSVAEVAYLIIGRPDVVKTLKSLKSEGVCVCVC